MAITTDPPLVAGLLWPLSAQVFHRFSPHLPITRFSGSVSFGRDAQENRSHPVKAAWV